MSARFPINSVGASLDALARAPLWQHGLDYDHGTGHGVGSYLGVHEGPARITKAPNTVALEPGMILSNEPGYYKADAFGIRTENLVVVTDCTDLPDADKPFLCFETITLAPIDRTLVVSELLTKDERAWFDAYHARVRAEISPLVEGDVCTWLVEVTEPLTA
jgi:Xaa-Pro aminopeptidase